MREGQDSFWQGQYSFETGAGFILGRATVPFGRWNSIKRSKHTENMKKKFFSRLAVCTLIEFDQIYHAELVNRRILIPTIPGLIGQDRQLGCFSQRIYVYLL